MTKLTQSRTGWTCLATYLACSLVSHHVGATTLRRMDLRDMVQAADRVVHARATGTRVYWDAAHRRILTDTDFEVIETAKGEGPGRLTVMMLGGRIDPIEMHAEGTPVFSVGEEVVMMASARPDGRMNLVGFSQGVFRVETDGRTGDRFVASHDAAQAQPLQARLPLHVFMESLRALASHGGVQLDAPRRQMKLLPAGQAEVTP